MLEAHRVDVLGQDPISLGILPAQMEGQCKSDPSYDIARFELESPVKNRQGGRAVVCPKI